MRGLWFILVVALVTPVAARAAAGGYRLTIVGEAPDRPALRVFMVRAEDHLRHVFKLDAPTHALRVELGGDRRYVLGDLLVWGVPDVAVATDLRHDLVRALLARRLVPVGATALHHVTAIPDWLVAALVYQVQRQYDRVLPPGCYPVLRSAYDAGRLPAPATLAAMAPPRGLPWLYGAYAEHCAGLLIVLRRREGDSPHQLLRAAALGIPPADAVTEQLPPATEPTARQQWYTREIGRLTVNSEAPRDYADVQRQVAALELVPVLAPERPGGIRQVPIEKVPDYLATYAATGRHAGALMGAILQILNDSPPILRPPLDDYLRAFGTLDRQGEEAFTAAITKARADLAAAAARGEAIQAFMVEQETGIHSPGRRLLQPFAAIRSDAIRVLDTEHQIGDYLDGIAK